ncbi:hypothetical protein [Algoriphagus boritolerans]|uniref:DNA repair protein RadC n=1 Tax=Algoriphagus boritolerans DSM 17298 = JCM 18970 TaxID=1120964 RepID=A0A1H5ZBW9_9BACT|nr:hypothetical protein [Algoriphagus boritolerans]SEG33792.1 DNA repair protein RadC [Algoriphagus boritolerans DSM 17298 = JCM 18970]
MEALTKSFHFNEVAEITLAYRPKIKVSQRPKVTCSRQVYDVLLKFWNSDSLEYIEQFQKRNKKRVFLAKKQEG